MDDAIRFNHSGIWINGGLALMLLVGVLALAATAWQAFKDAEERRGLLNSALKKNAELSQRLESIGPLTPEQTMRERLASSARRTGSPPPTDVDVERALRFERGEGLSPRDADGE
jgi:hypothetical protein